ncbi:MAG TPA: cytochrome c oxidase assembly protein [Solimonas sp.]|nr:cytochrome c oxidase assembly protein [Solimonas sp.]
MNLAARKNVVRLCGLTAAMFAFGFALVPMYNLLCDAIGLNGKVKMEAVAASSAHIDTSRTVTVEFVTTVNGGGPWTFTPDQPRVQLHPGEFRSVSFFAQNTRDTEVVGQAVPQVAPWDAARYIRKSECFCFNHQAFKPGEGRHMPVVFTLDPELPPDVDTLTLSYTFFDVTEVAAKQDRKPRS